jgi:hypothetical protein
MSGGAKPLRVEQVVPTGNDYHPSKFDDLNMLVIQHGRERTAQEFRELLGTAGFMIRRILPTPSQWSVVEAVPQWAKSLFVWIDEEASVLAIRVSLMGLPAQRGFEPMWLSAAPLVPQIGQRRSLARAVVQLAAS